MNKYINFETFNQTNRMSFRSEIEDIVKRVRNETVSKRRIERQADNSEGIPEHEFILGECVENSRILAKQIASETDYSVQIIKGAYNYEYEDMNLPESYEEAENYGTLHHWVRVSNGDEVLRCNLVDIRRGNESSFLVSEERPARFIDFNKFEVVQ